MTWEIQPRTGIGPLQLGMTPQAVSVLLDPLGKVEAKHQAFDGSLDEFRSLTLPICNYVDDNLAQIDTTSHVADVLFKGRDVFNTNARDIFKLFETENGGALAGLGFILFLNLNVYLQNFFDAQALQFFDVKAGGQDDRRAAVFATGRFDKLMSRFRPFEVD